MTVVNTYLDKANLTMTVVSEFEASVERVWQVLADARTLERWWGPPTWPATFTQHELEPGGESRYYMPGPEGERSHGWWSTVAVDPPNRLEVDDGFSGDDGEPLPDEEPMRMIFTLEGAGPRTRMTVVTTFASKEQLTKVTEMGMEEGLRAALNQIDDLLQHRPSRRSPPGTRLGAVIVESVRARVYPEGEAPDPRTWPFTLAPVAQLLRDGLHFTRPVTFLVGENGSGKSTIVEALAEAYGVSATGGGAGGRRYASAAVRSPLGEAIHLHRTKAGSGLVGEKARGYFLRAETAYGVFAAVTGSPAYGGHDLLSLSHGESFLAVFDTRFAKRGLYLLDEPESALSFTSCLKLLALFMELTERGSQVVCATHSPLLASLPGAQILEVGEHGIREVAWEELELVDHWRAFLNRPDSYLRHLGG